MIIISRKSLRDPKRKKKFVASVCKCMHEFLTSDKPIEIELSGGVSLSDAAEALRNIAEILDTAGNITKGDEEADAADWWKKEDDDDDDD